MVPISKRKKFSEDEVNDEEILTDIDASIFCKLVLCEIEEDLEVDEDNDQGRRTRRSMSSPTMMTA